MFKIIGFVAVFVVVTGNNQDALFTSNIKIKPSNILNYAGKTYYFGNVFKANYYGAFQFCRQQGMQLVSVMSKGENDRLHKFARDIGLNNAHFWTSGTNLVDSKQFVWLSDGSPIIYNNWYPGEPNGQVTADNCANEHCVELYIKEVDGREAFYWNDVLCENQYNFICEKYENS